MRYGDVGDSVLAADPIHLALHLRADRACAFCATAGIVSRRRRRSRHRPQKVKKNADKDKTKDEAQNKVKKDEDKNRNAPSKMAYRGLW